MTRNSTYAIIIVILLFSVTLTSIQVKQEPEVSLNSRLVSKSSSKIAPSPVHKLEGPALVETLLQGGYVIYLHLPTDTSAPPKNHRETLLQCSAATYNSRLSKDKAQAIGMVLRALKIPIGKVLSSELCQVAEKARIIFEEVETTDDLESLALATSAAVRERRTDTLRKMLSTKPGSGTNMVLVGHLSNLRAVTNESLPKGVGIVFEPLEEPGGFRIVGKIDFDSWTTLAKQVVSEKQSRPMSSPHLESSEIEGVAFNPKPVMLLPDLQVKPPEQLYIQYEQNTSKKFVRFSTTIANIGQGPLEMWGQYDPDIDKILATQRIQSRNEVLEKVIGYFIYHPTHLHWHYENFTVFELWSYNAADGTLEHLVATTGKMSFCISDGMVAYRDMQNTPAVAQFPTCNPRVQGISVGWGDTYFSTVPGQHLDITNVPDGYYAVRSIIDPDNLLLETNRANNVVTVYVKISGNDIIAMPNYGHE